MIEPKLFLPIVLRRKALLFHMEYRNTITIVDIANDITMIKCIVEVLVYTNEGQLKVGDEILAVAVGGDIRESVFPALVDAVERIKKEATRKKEFAK